MLSDACEVAYDEAVRVRMKKRRKTTTGGGSFLLSTASVREHPTCRKFADEVRERRRFITHVVDALT